MKIHELKIAFEYGVAKLRGEKLFEIRKNDRDFQVGDLVHYTLCRAATRKKMAEFRCGNEKQEKYLRTNDFTK